VSRLPMWFGKGEGADVSDAECQQLRDDFDVLVERVAAGVAWREARVADMDAGKLPGDLETERLWLGCERHALHLLRRLRTLPPVDVPMWRLELCALISRMEALTEVEPV